MNLKRCNVYAKEKCQKCCAKFYSSGGLRGQLLNNFHGSINDAYDIGCELQKKRVECAIMIEAATAGLQTEAEDMRGRRRKACRKKQGKPAQSAEPQNARRVKAP